MVYWCTCSGTTAMRPAPAPSVSAAADSNPTGLWPGRTACLACTSRTVEDTLTTISRGRPRVVPPQDRDSYRMRRTPARPTYHSSRRRGDVYTAGALLDHGKHGPRGARGAPAPGPGGQ